MRSVIVFGVFLSTCIALSSGRTLSKDDTEKNLFHEDTEKNNLRKLAFANNELAFNLYRELASDSSKNLFFSPLSISTALSMLLYGTREDTEEELRKTLGYEKALLFGDLVHETFSHYFSEVLHSGNSSDGYVLNSVNSILADKRIDLLEEYRHNVQDLYKAIVRNVDFAGESPKILEEINNWVKEKTNGKIEKLFDELSPETTLVLLNAVYFKGNWKLPFHPSKTWDEVFYNYGLESGAKNVSMMHRTRMFRGTYADDFHVLELPYKGDNVSMLIFLPHQRDGLQALEQSLTPQKLDDIISKMRYGQIQISLPRFNLEFEEGLSRPLQSLGVNRIFSGADFSGMSPSRGVFVSEIIHKAIIEVNEQGSEAAAVTGTALFRSSGLGEFRANHPFLFLLVEKGSKSNMVWFMGRVNHL